jgi:hypothetical protein
MRWDPMRRRLNPRPTISPPIAMTALTPPARRRLVEALHQRGVIHHRTVGSRVLAHAPDGIRPVIRDEERSVRARGNAPAGPTLWPSVVTNPVRKSASPVALPNARRTRITS